MKDGETIGKVHDSMYHQIQKCGFATPVTVLMDLGVLTKRDHDNWRYGKVDYLERVCEVNLSKLSSIMREVRGYARKNGLKPSWSYYKQWGRKGKSTVKLRFTKSGDENVERSYATHFVSPRLSVESNVDGVGVEDAGLHSIEGCSADGKPNAMGGIGRGT